MEHKAEISRTREVLGWEPEHSFQEGLEKTVDYYT
jgi:nucleoside-diphosphate-sugar epimerase